MTGETQNRDKLQALIDAVEQSILNATDDEVTEDFVAAGIDAKEAEDHTGNLIAQTIKGHSQKKLRAARAGFESARAEQVPVVPQTFSEKLTLLQSIFSAEEVPPELTMAFRDARHMSDEDISSLLDDLAELGYLDNREGEE